MKIFYFTLVCFILVSENFVSAIYYEKCGNGEGIVTIRNLSFEPDPISLSEKNVRVFLDYEVHDEIQPDMIVDIKMWKVLYFSGIKIRAPCLLGEGKCNMEYCQLLNSFNAVCLRGKGNYSKERINVNLPELGDTALLFYPARLHIEVRMYEKSSKREMGCYKIISETIRA